MPGAGCPGLSGRIDFLQRVDDIFVVQSDIRCAESRTIARIECCIPLLVAVPETHDDQIGVFDQVSRANRIDLG